MDNAILSLAEIEKIIIDTAKIINADSSLLLAFGIINGSARPAVKVDHYGYHYIINERGEEYEHRITTDLKDLLYLVFKQITFTMAVHYELKNRVKNQDCRRIVFAKQMELMNKIDADFGGKLKLEIEEELKRNPYND